MYGTCVTKYVTPTELEMNVQRISSLPAVNSFSLQNVMQNSHPEILNDSKKGADVLVAKSRKNAKTGVCMNICTERVISSSNQS